MYSGNDQISKRQLQILLILDILGVSVMTLPRLNALMLGENGWLLVIGGGALAAVSVYLICSLGAFLGGEGFYKGLCRLWGRVPAVLVSGGLFAKLVIALSADIRTFSGAAKLWLLPQTPLWIIALVTIFPCFIGALYSYETRARLGEIFVFIILIPFVLVYAPYLFKVDYLGLFGSISENIYWDKVIYFKGSLINCFAFTGMEFLFLSFNYLKEPGKVKASVIKAVILGVLLVTLVNFVTISLLGAPLCGEFDFPGAEIMDVSTYSKGKGAVMMSFFYLSVVIFAVGAVFFGGELLRDITGGKRGLCKALAALLGFALSLYPRNIEELGRLSVGANFIFGGFYGFVLPVLLILTLKLKKGDAYD